MSKKVSIIISVILFVILAVLLVCEKMNPGAGSAPGDFLTEVS